MVLIKLNLKAVVYLLMPLITTSAIGQIGDCDRTLVFEKTYDFNEQKGRYFYKNPVKRIMGEHSLTIKCYLSESTGTLIETFETQYDDIETHEGQFLNAKAKWINTLDEKGDLVCHFGFDGDFGHLVGVKGRFEEMISLIILPIDDELSEQSNEVKFYNDVIHHLDEYYNSERNKHLPTSKCENPLELYQCLFGKPENLNDILNCD